MTTHQQLLYHIVFSTKNRKRFLSDGMREDVFAYMAGVCKNLDGFALEVGGFYDHAHLLVRIPAKVSVSDFVGKLKANTSKHIHLNNVSSFAWQDGFGVFTVSPSNKDAVAAYIRNQMQHHQHLTQWTGASRPRQGLCRHFVPAHCDRRLMAPAGGVSQLRC